MEVDKKRRVLQEITMTVADIIMFLVKVLAGTGVFLIGVHLLTENIEQLATNRIKDLFNKTANKKMLNVGIGAVTTALVQSSGVTTVLIVGFVNVGIMSLFQATAMIMGANIGTTITAQIAALAAFDFTTYIQILACVGVLITMICKREKIKNIGFIVAGLGIIFIGLDIMSGAMSDQKYKMALQAVFETVKNPVLLLFIGVLITALVQSSSATTSVIIAMSMAGLVIGTGRNEVLYIILGTNIGSCVTALMSSMGAGTNAKRTSLIHLMFNSFGSIIYFIILICFPSFMDVTFKSWFSEPATQIAMFHTFFNTSCTILFLPFTNVFVKLSKILIKDKKEQEKEHTYLDQRLLTTSSLAISAIKKETVVLSDIAMNAFTTSYKAFKEKDVSKTDDIHVEIERANKLSQNIINYLIKTSATATGSEAGIIAGLHNNIGDVMRITDISDNFTKYTKKAQSKNISFSDGVIEKLDEMVSHVENLYELTKKSILENDKSFLDKIDQTEEEIDRLRKILIDGHIERLNKGQCKPESSGIFINLVSNVERLGDHLTFIAHSI